MAANEEYVALHRQSTKCTLMKTSAIAVAIDTLEQIFIKAKNDLSVWSPPPFLLRFFNSLFLFCISERLAAFPFSHNDLDFVFFCFLPALPLITTFLQYVQGKLETEFNGKQVCPFSWACLHSSFCGCVLYLFPLYTDGFLFLCCNLILYAWIW